MFLRRTMDSRALSYEACICSLQPIYILYLSESGYLLWSNNPSLNLISRILEQASSIRDSGITPSFTNPTAFSKKSGVDIIMSLPALMAISQDSFMVEAIFCKLCI